MGDDAPAVVAQAEKLKDDLTAATDPNGDSGSACADDFAGLQSLLADADSAKTASCQVVPNQSAAFASIWTEPGLLLGG